MINSMKILFHLRTSKQDKDLGIICCRITVNKQRAEIGSTQIKIKKSDFDKKTGTIKGKTDFAQVANKRLDHIKGRINAIYLDYEVKEIKASAEQVKAKFLNDGSSEYTFLAIASMFLREIEMSAESVNKNISIGTYKSYKHRLQNFERFLVAKKMQDHFADEIKQHILKRFETYMIIENDCAKTYAGKNCECVRTCINWAFENGYIQTNPLLGHKIKIEYEANTTHVDNYELDILESYDFLDWYKHTISTLPLGKHKPMMWKKKSLERVRDLYLFSCYTGLAYADLKSFNSSWIILEDNRLCLFGKRNKTGTEFFVPLIQKAIDLLERYGIKVGDNTKKLPVPSNKTINLQLKKVCQIVGINKELWFHTARKTFANMIINEYNMTTTASIRAMGHSNEKELKAYVKTNNKRVLSELPNI